MTTALDCSICSTQPSGEVNQCPQHHIFCAPCLWEHQRSDDRADSGLCPVCQTPLPEAPIRVLVVCTAAPECDWRGAVRDQVDHEARCVVAKCARLVHLTLEPLRAENSELRLQMGALREENATLRAQVADESATLRAQVADESATLRAQVWRTSGTPAVDALDSRLELLRTTTPNEPPPAAAPAPLSHAQAATATEEGGGSLCGGLGGGDETPDVSDLEGFFDSTAEVVGGSPTSVPPDGAGRPRRRRRRPTRRRSRPSRISCEK